MCWYCTRPLLGELDEERWKPGNLHKAMKWTTGVGCKATMFGPCSLVRRAASRTLKLQCYYQFGAFLMMGHSRYSVFLANETPFLKTRGLHTKRATGMSYNSTIYGMCSLVRRAASWTLKLQCFSESSRVRLLYHAETEGSPP